MDLGLADKVIVITGGAKGIGRAIAELLAIEGAIPVVVGRNKNDNLKVVSAIKSYGGNAFQVEAELSVPAECQKAITLVVTQFGKIDGMVNNAGINDGVGLENGSYEKFMDSLHQNMVHYFLIVHYALPFLIESKGVVLNISSKVAITGQGYTSGYAASNGGINALTREWAVELLKYGIRVNSIAVGESCTPAYEEWLNTFNNPKEKIGAITATIPLENRFTKVEEIADTAAFLLSERSSHTTGQIVCVDGGYVHLDRGLKNL